MLSLHLKLGMDPQRIVLEHVWVQSRFVLPVTCCAKRRFILTSTFLLPVRFSSIEYDVVPHVMDLLGALSDAGDLQLPNTSLERMRDALNPQVDELLARNGDGMIWLGGDHSITLPLLRAYHRKYGKPLNVVVYFSPFIRLLISPKPGSF